MQGDNNYLDRDSILDMIQDASEQDVERVEVMSWEFIELCRLALRAADDSPGTPLGRIRGISELAEKYCGYQGIEAYGPETAIARTLERATDPEMVMVEINRLQTWRYGLGKALETLPEGDERKWVWPVWYEIGDIDVREQQEMEDEDE